jgi:hypothetical protein
MQLHSEPRSGSRDSHSGPWCGAVRSTVPAEGHFWRCVQSKVHCKRLQEMQRVAGSTAIQADEDKESPTRGASRLGLIVSVQRNVSSNILIWLLALGLLHGTHAFSFSVPGPAGRLFLHTSALASGRLQATETFRSGSVALRGLFMGDRGGRGGSRGRGRGGRGGAATAGRFAPPTAPKAEQRAGMTRKEWDLAVTIGGPKKSAQQLAQLLGLAKVRSRPTARPCAGMQLLRDLFDMTVSGAGRRGN